MIDPNNPCLFCNTNNKEYLIENDLAFATFDSYPVSKYHLLVIPKRHVENYFDLSNDEILEWPTYFMPVLLNLFIIGYLWRFIFYALFWRRNTLLKE